MWRELIISILICSVRNTARVAAVESAAGEDEQNPFLDAAKSFMEEAFKQNPEMRQSSGMSTLNSLLHTFKNGDGGQLGDLLSAFNVPSSKNVAGDILSGIAGLMSGNDEQKASGKSSGGWDPQLLGQVANVLSSLASNQNGGGDDEANEIPGSSGAHSGSQGPDWGAILGLATNLLSSAAAAKENNNAAGAGAGGGGLEALLQGGGLEGLMNLLPLMTGSAPSGHVHFANHDLEDEDEHQKYEKSSYMPPFMNIVHEYWDSFKSSEIGNAVWKKSGLETIFKLFMDKQGYFQVDRIFESMENTSFRREWIKSLSTFIGEWVKHVSNPATQARYMANIKLLGHNFLNSQGYPKYVKFDPARPSESIAVITDAVLKRNFGLKIDSGKYIKPAVFYVQDLFKLSDKKSIFNLSHLSSRDISSKLSDLLNNELIEPILSVWRAYKYSIQHTQCDKQLICYLNQKNSTPKNTGLKPGVIKLSSLIASWYLSGRTGTPFWKLYNAATEDHVCEVHYPANCQAYFDHERLMGNLHGDEL